MDESNQFEQHRLLLSQVAEGSEPAFAALYAMYKNSVYNTALSYLQNTVEAEDVTQDVFVKIHASAAFFQGKSSVKTWIYRITINHTLDQLRHKKRQKRFGDFVQLFQPGGTNPSLDIPDFDHPGVLLDQKEDARIVFKAIALLPEQQKTAFILAFIEDLPRQEVALVMNVSIKAVESLLQRAKKNLRSSLDFLLPDRRV
jgi:RNA polymerase sigma-70 factor (ECF subfamily)